MPIERAPQRPLPPGYRPPASIPYRVLDGDSWHGIALRHAIDADQLIFFNFHTNDAHEVNWYLRRHTGCKQLSSDSLNWAFSSIAEPGLIFLPMKKADMRMPSASGAASAGKGSNKKVWDYIKHNSLQDKLKRS